jgi:hypothetical protein
MKLKRLAFGLAVMLVALGMTTAGFAQTAALVKPVSATAEVNPDDAMNTLDDNPIEFNRPTYWQAADYYEACITYDMGQTMRVVGFRETAGPFPGNPFVAYVSTDGVDFTEVYWGDLTRWAYASHYFDPVNVQYIALCIQRTNATGYGELADFRALVSLSLVVDIDVKPGSDLNPVNASSNGNIPVAILTTDSFDATTVDPLSVRFGPERAAASHGRGHIEDVDGDGDLDMLLHFRTQEAGIIAGDTSVFLEGTTTDGQPIEGADMIETVGSH